MSAHPFRPAARPATRLSRDTRERIELNGLTDAELNGALYALEMVEDMARGIVPQGRARIFIEAEKVAETNAYEVLKFRAETAIMLAQATRETLPLPIGRRTHGTPPPGPGITGAQ